MQVLVDRPVEEVHGHAVLTVIDGEYTLKRLHHPNDCIELHRDDPAVMDMIQSSLDLLAQPPPGL
jgi:SOS-response transcriptional repressor LexA